MRKLYGPICAVLFALLCGGLFLIATGLVPYWRSLSPPEFTSAFAAALPFVGGVMKRLTIVATVSVVVAAVIAYRQAQTGRFWIIAASGCAVGMLLTVALYFGTANPVLAAGGEPAEVVAELQVWSRVNWVRTVLGIVGMFCVARAAVSDR